MRKTHVGLVLVAVTLLAVSAASAGITKRGTATPTNQAIFHIDSPAAGANVFGIVDVTGYVFDIRRGVSQITLMVDDVAINDADINLPRSDVRRKYPGFDGEELESGFATSFLARNFSTGEHVLAIRVRYSNGDEEMLGERTVNVDNARYQGPIGGLDYPRQGDQGDPNTSEDYVTGPYALTGWVLDDVGIRTRLTPTGCTGAPSISCRWLADIEVMVDGRTVGQSVYYLPRPDVANAHPDVPGAFNSGFQMNLDTTRITNGEHVISVRAWDDDPDENHSAIIATRKIWVDNNYTTLKPFGRIDFPMNNGNFFSCQCHTGGPPVSGIEYDVTSHLDWVAGWVIDQNDNWRFEGIKNVELLFDGEIVKSTWTDCKPVCMASNANSLYANCYGIERMDIEYLYPQFLNDAKYAGFFFAVDTDYWLWKGKLHRGLNYISIQVHTMDPTRPPVIIDQIPIIVRCNEELDTPSFGELEKPTVLEDMQGSDYLVKGWVVDYSIRKLLFYVDGNLDGSAVGCDGVHLCIRRNDVFLKYPWLPYPYYYFGFEYHLDTTKYVDGIHNLVIESEDAAGFHGIWMQRQIRFDNFNR